LSKFLILYFIYKNNIERYSLKVVVILRHLNQKIKINVFEIGMNRFGLIRL